MATQYLRFKGPCKWAKVFKPDSKYNLYSINLYLNAETKAAYEKSGIQVGIKSDEDGEYVVFRRPAAKIIKSKMVELGAPRVEDRDLQPFTDTIGNGSIVEVTVDVYDTIKGKGHTLRGVKVLDHVAYEKST